MNERDERDARIDQIASAIERYVALHPNASDTIDGIHRWWLMHEPLAEDTTLIEPALTRLIERGIMMRRTLPGDTVLFCRR